MPGVGRRHIITEWSRRSTIWQAGVDGAAQTAPGSIRVHVVRHGQVYNPKAVFYGRLPGFCLHPEGRHQAATAAEQLRTKIGERVLLISSPLERAQETASIIRESLGLPERPRSEAGVLEGCTPHDGRPVSEMQAIDWALYDPAHYPVGGSTDSNWENFEDVGKRAVATVQRLAAAELVNAGASGATDIILVTHGDVCCALRLWGRGGPIDLEGRQAMQAEGYPMYCSTTTLKVDTIGRCIGVECDSVIAETPDGKKA